MKALHTLDRWLAVVLRGLVRVYQLTLSPFIGRQCRFHPTCSEYARDALSVHGGLKGSYLTARRLLRCHPWGGSGYDPVQPCGDHALSKSPYQEN